MTEKSTKNTSYLSLKGFHRAVPIILAAIAVFIGLCLFMKDIGTAGRFISTLLFGLFASGAYAIPVLLALHAAFYASDLANKTIISRIIFSLVSIVFISALIYSVTTWSTEPVFTPDKFYADGLIGVGGGYIGGVVGYAIVSTVGKVGLIIVALTVFALYASFFFTGGKRAVGKFFYGILRAIVFACAFIERKLKAFFKKIGHSGDKKRWKNEEKKNAELGADDFFEVDNGLERLEITELGILEKRDERELEAHPTLQDKIRHKSAVDSEPVYTEREPIRSSVRYDDLDDIIIEREVEDEDTAAFDLFAEDGEDINKAERSAPAFVSDDESADSVFSADFDPFSLSLNERMADKPSSRAKGQDDYPTVSESIADITETEARRALARDAFERRKAEIVASRRRSESVPTGRGSEPILDRKTVEFTNTTSEDLTPKRSEEDEVSVKIEKKEKLAESYDMTFGKPEEDEDDFTPEESVYNEPTPSVFNEEQRTEEFSYSEFKEEDAVSDEPSFEPEPTVPQLPDEEDEEEDVHTLYTERTHLTAFENTDEVDEPQSGCTDLFEDIEDAIEEEDDEDFPTEQIPPEEENPALKSYRNLFTMFNSDEKAEKDEEPEAVAISEELYTEEEYAEEEPEPTLNETDEPAFDTATDEEYDAEAIEDEEYEEDEDILASVVDRSEEEEEKPVKKKADFSSFRLPPIDLLVREERKNDDQINAEIKENKRILIETLDSFNVMASIKGVDIGPRITRYEVVPARGVKVREITGRFEDIELNLAAEGVRMEAPIPGKSAIGFEIPNKHPSIVRLRELIETDEFEAASSTTFVSIGKDVAGNPVFGDISKYPHVLICGATGTGKSVCINSLMMSMLFKSRPDQVKFIMIDPKKVEFKVYSGIPHLLIPVITEAKQAAGALMWAVEEMERRYEVIEKHCLRNIEAYNEKWALDNSIGEYIPKIVIVIDELADLMMQVRDPVEDLIMRIAQKARAAGIHLVLGTQRPSVQVITGNIKANIPSRISCKVSSQTDSRTIFDMGGAEKLLNKGDMLYWPVDRTAPLRVQGSFVSDAEVEAVINFIKSESEEPQYDEAVLTEINKAAQKCGNNKKSAQGFDDDDEDEDDQPGYYSDQRFLDAVELAIRSKKVSTSLLQRKLSIGYGKAAKYIDAMESIGIVSEPNGQRPRDVLITMDEWHEKLSRVEID